MAFNIETILKIFNMPRRLSKFYNGGYYHIYNRGVAGQPIFLEDDNYFYLLQLIKKYSQKIEISVLAYCLMPNHYHLLVRQESEKAAGLLPQRVFNVYSKSFNNRYKRSGTLFESPYKAVEVDRYAYLIHLCRYIHANPVKAGLVKSPDEWVYSNYLDWIGERDGKLVDKAFISEHFRDVSDYRGFVFEYLIDEQVIPEGVKKYLP
ncbi:MAG: transposase [Anaerolineales bacterium]